MCLIHHEVNAYAVILSGCRSVISYTEIFARSAVRCGLLKFYVTDDFITNLFLTVLDLRLETKIVVRALEHYNSKRAHDVASFIDLKQLLESGQTDSEIAKYLWGYNLWTRVSILRRLVSFFESIDVTTQSALERWARSSQFERDFKGQASGLSYAAFKWLVIRQGVETIKPDVHVHNFVKEAIGRRLSDAEAVSVLERIAEDIGIKASQLDSRIWNYQRRRRALTISARTRQPVAVERARSGSRQWHM
jgi:hypothetical protein